jgi:hypothetical protein
MADWDGKSGRRAGINHPSEQLAWIAARQGGVVSRGQLLDLGFTDNQIRRRVRDGWLHRLHHDVFAVGHTRLSDHAHLFAVPLTFGPRAFLSHRTAAAGAGARL